MNSVREELGSYRPLKELQDREPANLANQRRLGLERVSVVIPTMNEAENIGWVLERLPSYVDEVVLVDGRSTDDTVARAQAIRPDIKVVLETKKGKGAALRAGFAACSGELIVMIDADCSMEPSEIDRFVALLSCGYDFVKGSRYMAGGGSTDITRIRSLGNRVLTGAVNTLFDMKFSDLCYGYIAFRKEHLEALDLQSDGFEIETELILHAIAADLKITEVPSHESPRQHGESNLRVLRDGPRVLRTLVSERFSRKNKRQERVEVEVPAFGPSEVREQVA
jgi:glycosyltransferase involved in cell wall biosynthesis